MRFMPTRREFLQVSAAALLVRPQAGSPRINILLGTGAPSETANNPFGLVIGPDRGLYWADYGGHRVMRFDFGTKAVSVIAGTGKAGYAGDGGPAVSAQLNAPHEVRFDTKGNIYVAERDNHVVRYIDLKSKTISTAAGTGMRGFSGDGGPANQAQLAQPHSIALDRADNVYICDIMNNRVRRIDPKAGTISTFAGNGEKGNTPDETSLDGTPVAGPRSIEIAPDGTLYLILREGNKVFSIDVVRRRLKRIAGTGELGYTGDGGPALNAKFGAPGSALNGPKGVAYADGMLYIADTENHVIRRIDLKQGTIMTIVGTGQRGDGPDGDPLACKLARPHGIFIQGKTLYIGDSENHRIRTLQLG
jgi:DNA-binding beta-propeller fold protein YncE